MLKVRLLEALAERGLRIVDAAVEGRALTSVKRNTISDIGNQNTNAIKFDILEDLCRGIDMTPDEFFVFNPPLERMERRVMLTERTIELLDKRFPEGTLAERIQEALEALDHRLDN